MDEHLQKQDWLEGNRPTIADIACPYIALATDGKIALEDYPHVIAWISRIKQLPGYIQQFSVGWNIATAMGKPTDNILSSDRR